MDKLIQIYKDLYEASIQKDMATIDCLLDEDYTLVHMTGIKQSKSEYMHSVQSGEFIYYGCFHLTIHPTLISETEAYINGKSIVEASVYGGARHKWRLSQRMKLKKRETGWKIIEAVASMY